MFHCSEQFLMYPDIPSRQWAFQSIVLRNRYYESLCSYLCCLLPTLFRLWQGSVCIYDSGLRTSLHRKKTTEVYYVFNDFCTGNVIAECNLTQINFEHTHNNKVLEKFLVSCPWNISTVQTVIPTVSTDHDSVFCSLQIPKNGKKVFFFRDQRENCRQRWYNPLRDANFNCAYRSMDPNEALCQLNSIMYSAFRISCPTRQVTVRDRDPIHVTPAVKLLMKQRNN